MVSRIEKHVLGNEIKHAIYFLQHNHTDTITQSKKRKNNQQN